MFFGESSHNLDAKNRVHVPKRFHPHLDRDPYDTLTAVLTRGMDGCLYLFSESGFERAIANLDTAPFSGAEQRRLQRLLFAGAQRLQLDAAGRILVPEKLKRRAGIEREAVFVGVAEKVEIWAKDRWERFEAESDGEFDRLSEVLGRGSAEGGPGAQAGGE